LSQPEKTHQLGNGEGNIDPLGFKICCSVPEGLK
jgi:hypothetical protein